MKGMLDVGKQFATLRILLATSRVSPARRRQRDILHTVSRHPPPSQHWAIPYIRLISNATAEEASPYLSGQLPSYTSLEQSGNYGRLWFLVKWENLFMVSTGNEICIPPPSGLNHGWSFSERWASLNVKGWINKYVWMCISRKNHAFFPSPFLPLLLPWRNYGFPQVLREAENCPKCASGKWSLKVNQFPGSAHHLCASRRLSHFRLASSISLIPWLQSKQF